MQDEPRAIAKPGQTQPTNTNGAGGDTATAARRRVSFSELVRIHFRWSKRADRDDDNSDLSLRYDAALVGFEAHAGEIVDAYWSRKQASAVALTVKDPGKRYGLFQRPREFRLHRVTDWVMAGKGEIADLLHECDVLALKASESPLRIPKAVMNRWLLAVEAHVLGFVERIETPTKEDVEEFVRRERRRLRMIEDYYQEAGERWGRWWYVVGMIVGGGALLGFAAVAFGLVLAYFGIFDRSSGATRDLYACIAAGGLGAFVSVLFRMAGNRGGFEIDHELGRFRVGLLGAYRPLLGAISGVILYLLVQTTLLPIEEASETTAFFVVVAFLAGFSEAWTKVVLGGAMRTIGRAPDEAEDGDGARAHRRGGDVIVDPLSDAAPPGEPQVAMPGAPPAPPHGVRPGG